MKSFEPIAIVGMAGVFPDAFQPDRLWQMIAERRSAIREVAPGRWPAPKAAMLAADLTPDKAYSANCGLIEGFALDPRDIDLPGLPLTELDPVHQITLHVGREAIASLKTAPLPRERTRVILAAIALPTDGAAAISRQLFEPSTATPAGSPPTPSRVQRLAARMVGLPAALLAQAFDLRGGAFTLDAACASSLYAVKLACDALQSHRADAVLAGGVSRPDCLYTQVGFSQLQALSPSGRCAPFDATADGLVVGEGAGMLVLKRLRDAVQDKGRILGVIRGIGLSNDMGGNLLAPDADGQLRAMRAAYRSAGWQPGDVDLIECHGAGTPRGDLTELAALDRLWQDARWVPHQCTIGSVKSNIGHLLTAAGAAGLIKVLLALEHRQLPPSCNFSRPPKGSPLVRGPFRVLAAPVDWHRRRPDLPRRAAVSAFGFGGINAHVLVEEWRSPQTVSRRPVAASAQTAAIRPALAGDPAPPVAIVGMAIHVGGIATLRQFQHAVFNSDGTIGRRPPNRWRGSERTATAGQPVPDLDGAYIAEIELALGEFRIPPNEIPDILPQHLLMLKVAAQALADAGLTPAQHLPRAGAVIGMDFDFEATNFHLRWISENQTASGPPLTANRTLGALGSIVASRVAREFHFGGPSFTVSAEETAGLHALQIGADALARSEVDTVLVGAVDMAGDLRRLLTARASSTYSSDRAVRPFDGSAGGTLPGDGAAALVIKRLDRAVADGDRVYAVFKGSGCASGKSSEKTPLAAETIVRSIRRACAHAAIDPRDLGYVETHGSGIPTEDTREARALHQVLAGSSAPVAVGATKHLVGHSGAAAGLVSVVKAALCLYHELIAPLNRIEKPVDADWRNGPLHLPQAPQFWFRNRREGPRRALAAAHTDDGTCMHVVLEGYDVEAAALSPAVRKRLEIERRQPMGKLPHGLFVVAASEPDGLPAALERFAARAATWTGPGVDAADIEDAARGWYRENGPAPPGACRVILLADAARRLPELIAASRTAVAGGTRTSGQGVWYLPDVKAGPQKSAFVFPGAGNHYLGMGRGIGVRWPEIMRQIDAESTMFSSQARPEQFMPYRADWAPGWQTDAYASISADPLTIIAGQVTHADIVSRLLRRFGVHPRAVIGYSLGEVAALVATRAWPQRDALHERLLSSDLFATGLVPPYTAARSAWRVPASQPVDWRVAVVRRPRQAVVDKCRGWETARLLIVNTPEECVIGGRKTDLEGVISALGCEAVYLEGVSTVHCDALQPVAGAYRDLHLLPVSAPAGVSFYSCAGAAAYPLTSTAAADSILKQGLEGFDFPALIESAYGDGIRIFVEMGPSGSCTRMIHRILDDRPHLALSACVKGESDHLTVMKTLAALAAAGLPVDLEALYGGPTTTDGQQRAAGADSARVRVPVGGKPLLPPIDDRLAEPEKAPQTAASPAAVTQKTTVHDLLTTFAQTTAASARAHESFLDFSNQLTQAHAQAFDLQNRMLAAAGQHLSKMPTGRSPRPVFSRAQCLEFARGSAARVLGPEFAAVDRFAARVRLPDEPLMLVDRIISIEGRKGSLGPGKVVTEHDVAAGAWYLDGDRAPVCIAVEAGQADLFLCAYLGIDLVVKGKRTYRLLDATVTFHRGLPRPGETIRYDIHIDKFIRQADTHMFLFRFEGHVGGEPLITMVNGCAGFFTAEEVRNSGGIIAGTEAQSAAAGRRDPDGMDLVPLEAASYREDQLDALRRGQAGACFGEAFAGIDLPSALALPGGRLRLIHRIRTLDPAGGRFGLGIIQAEADIHPDDWFLTCHFVDDMVMPGTLMYECCAHALRVLLLRYGWICDRPEAHFEPVAGVPATLKCRGPVTPQTRRVLYEIEIKQIGYRPQPYAIADAHMYADGQRIVRFDNMTLQMTGATRQDLEAFWRQQRRRLAAPAAATASPPPFDRRHLETFASGNPSSAFGRPYRVFDRERFIARLPQPPFLCIDRIVKVEPEQWVLKPGGWVEAECDLRPDAWYLRANRSAVVPYAILMEIALQPCGWLAAYMGSALKSDKGLRFRNLGGKAIVHRDPVPADGTLSVRTRLTQVSEVEDMIIEHFEFQVGCKQEPVYDGTTYFGFFTPQALARQDGLRLPAAPGADRPAGKQTIISHDFEDIPPLFPEDHHTKSGPPAAYPAKALRMIDRIEAYLPDSGPHGLGTIRATKRVDPNEWFFKAHFHQDPVCPGSLGIESFIQVLKFVAAQRYGRLFASHRCAMLPAEQHGWTYRGQIVPQNRQITVEAVITAIGDLPEPTIRADGVLSVDGLPIYQLENFGIRLVRNEA